MYNKVILIGNLTRDIEMKYLANNTALAKGAIATSHKYKMQSGEQKEEVCFIDFTIFGRVAEVANQYLHKGSKVMLDGRLQFEQWTDNQTGTKRSKHTLLVSEMKMLDSKGEISYQTNTKTSTTQQSNQNSLQNTKTTNNSTFDVSDIPDFLDENGEPPF